MRLLLVSSEFPPGPGGIGTHAYQIASHLTQLGWKVAVITPQDYASEEEIGTFNEAQPFPIIRLRPVAGAPVEALYRRRVLSRCVRKWKPEILLASGDRAVWLTAGFARFHKLPWVAVGHGTEFKLPAAWERALVRWSFQQATAVACVSHYTFRQMLASGIEPQAGQVIANGADATRFKVLAEHEVKEFRKRLGFDGARLLLTVGSVTERKGQDVVIRALPHILQKSPQTHYLVAGMPAKEREFMTLARELGVADHVHFLGRVEAEKLVNLLNSCDLFVMTSRHTSDGDFEGYGIAVVEAALCAKPAVVSVDSGLVEAIVEGETGLGVPQGDELATASAILTLLKDEELRRSMGEAARRSALEGRTWEHSAREYDALLRRLLQKGIATSVEEYSEVAGHSQI